MKSPSALLFGISFALGLPTSAGASDRCTIMYRVDATFEVSDTDFSKGDETVEGVEGSLVLEFPRDEQGHPADGKVKVLHFAMYESFTIASVVTVKTRIHHFTPTCNGVREPSWRRASDEGFPSQCKYTGNHNAVAIGSLRKNDRVIEWGKCKAAPSYWARDRRAYNASSKSKGKGCLNQMRVVGNIHCDGRLACKWGGLQRGNNPQFDVFTQPLIHGPPGSERSVAVSPDLSTIRTPIRRSDGHQSYNLPNDAPSRTWFSWVATRNDSSRFTTCARSGSVSRDGQVPEARRGKRRKPSREVVDEGGDQ
ncbi:MAG: hypothetical protein KJN97_14225 [Deltaproteobacteria bacterium]|nr:hypothetical protein [Deltaproteobacteria bacterium]